MEKGQNMNRSRQARERQPPALNELKAVRWQHSAEQDGYEWQPLPPYIQSLIERVPDQDARDDILEEVHSGFNRKIYRSGDYEAQLYIQRVANRLEVELKTQKMTALRVVGSHVAVAAISGSVSALTALVVATFV